MTRSALSKHVSRFVSKNDKPLHSGFAIFNAMKITKEATDVLKTPTLLAEGLINLQEKLDYCGSDLDEALEELLGVPFMLDDELTARHFLDCLHPERPLFDNGVSPVHGKYAHALQQYIIEHNLGKDKFAELLDIIRESPILDCEYMGDGRKWTLWDEYMDRPTPYTIKNCQRQSCREAILSGDRQTVPMPSCLDGRSPEWLTTVIALAPPDCGIQSLHESISRDLSKRGENIHEDIFITGFENLNYFQKLAQFKTKRRFPWTEEETRALETGYRKYGRQWAQIKKDPDFRDILKNRDSGQIKDKARNMKLVDTNMVISFPNALRKSHISSDA